MSKPVLMSLAALALAASAQAQTPPAGGAPPPAPPRSPGIPVALATEAGLTAIATCLGNTYKVTALIVDSGGDTVALLTGDGAAIRTNDIARTKVSVVLKYKVASGVIADRVKTDAALAAEIKADPKIGAARQGALPIMAGGQFLGAMAVSGAPGGDKDEVCTHAGLDKIASRLK